MKTYPRHPLNKAVCMLMVGLCGVATSSQAEEGAVNQSMSESLMALELIAPANANLPTVTLDPITVTATIAHDSEETDDYIVPVTDSATGLTLGDRETPQSTTVITDQQIEDQRLTNVSDVVKNTPGVAAVRIDAGRTAFYARGFDINQYLVDGLDVDIFGGWAAGEDLASMAMYDRVEIVRGATGLMSGSGEPSASLNLIRKHANSVAPAAEISLNADSYNEYGATLDVGAGLNDSGSVRGRFIADYQDGNTFVDWEEKGHGLLYAVLDADITDSTAISVGAKYQRNKQHETMWGALPSYFADGSKADWPIDKSTSADWVEWNSENTEYFGSLAQALGDNWQIELKGSHAKNTTDDKLFYLNGFTVDRETGLGPSAFPGKYAAERVQNNIQAKLAGSFAALGQSHQAMIGASYNKNDLLGSSWEAKNIAPMSSLIDWDGSYPEPDWGDKRAVTDYTITEQALLAAAQLKVADPVTLILGSRLSNYKKIGMDSFKEIDFEATSVWTPYAGIIFDASDNHSVYASYTEIFEPQQERDINNDPLEPIVGTNYEVGIKSSNDDDTLHSQFSLFRIEQNNLAQLDNGKTIPGSSPPAPAYYGADGTVSQGIDVEVSGNITPNWQTTIGFSNFEAKDQNDKTVNPSIPHTLIKAFTTYDMSDIMPGLTIGGGVHWSGSRYRLLKNPVSNQLEKYIQEPVTLASLMARYEVNDHLELQMNIDNLFDKKYIDSNYFNQIYFGEPLTVKGKLTYRF